MNDSTLREIGGPPVASAMGRRGRVLRQAVAAGASAKASAGELAKLKQNPVSGLRQVILDLYGVV